MPRSKPSDRMLDPDRAICDRFRERVIESGKTKQQVAKEVGIGVAQLYRILRGNLSNPKRATINALDAWLKRPLAQSNGNNDYRALDAATIPDMGAAEVGTFRAERPRQRGTFGDVRPLDQRYVNKPRFGVTVTDGSLEGLVYAPGAIMVVALVIAYSDDMGIEDGKVYLIDQPNSDGQIETAFRRATVRSDGYEFTPLFRDAAKNRRHNIVVSRKDFAAKKIEIVGLFYTAYSQYV